MSDTYRIFGSEMSPYSVKIRSYFRFKQIPHDWLLRRGDQVEEYKKYARLPIVPTVVTPQDEPLQDSTPIMEAMEAMFPERMMPVKLPAAFSMAIREDRIERVPGPRPWPWRATIRAE